jgi:uncharacterized membrane protein YphA (DoxX/SURF4 family)
MPPIHASWTMTQKITFRFFCCFFVIYVFPFPLNILDYTSLGIGSSNTPGFIAWYFRVLDKYTDLWHAIIPWVGAHMLHLKTPITTFTNGSGDTTYDYVLVLAFFLLSILGTILWSVLDRKRKSYRQAYYWLRVLVRYNLAIYMLIYGFAKVYHLQMPGPRLSDLVRRFGYKSPMGLAWSFVGFSPAFSAFTGWGEVIGGALLFFRRTTLLGAVVLVAVLSNVVLINYCYDVPVKLFSSELLLMDLFLLAPYARPLADFFIRNKPTAPLPSEFTWKRPRFRWIACGLKCLIIAAAFYGNISSSVKTTKTYGDATPKPKLYGIYDVETFVRNKDTIAPLITDTTRWKQLVVQNEGYASVFFMNEHFQGMRFKVDSSLKKATLSPGQDTSVKALFVIGAPDSIHLTMAGRLKSDSLYVVLRKVDLQSFTLVSRGFHWVNEVPFGR